MHNVLNAKSMPEKRRLSLRQAKGRGDHHTNMAGRGTDILLGGNPEYMAKKGNGEFGVHSGKNILRGLYITLKEENLIAARKNSKAVKEYKEITDAEKAEVKKLGGWGNRHLNPSRRIDNQLRGRSAGRATRAAVFSIFLSRMNC